jgi:hypothetical protein
MWKDERDAGTDGKEALINLNELKRRQNRDHTNKRDDL